MYSSFSKPLVLLLLLLLLVIVSFDVVQSSLLASSKVQICKKSSSEPLSRAGDYCDKKFVVALSVRNGQGETDQIVANIRYVENETTTKLRREQLKKPFRVIVTKSDVFIHYPLIYLGYVNNNPYEYSIVKYSWLIRQVKCKDQPIWRTKGKDKSTCGHKRNFNGHYIEDSQGYCCKHTKDELLSRKWQYRRGKGEKVSWKYVHHNSEGICMDTDQLWYFTFEILEPYIVYKINVTVQQLDYSKVSDDPDDKVDVWRTIGYVTVGPEKIGDNTANSYKSGHTSGPQIKVSWEGDFYGATTYTNLLHKYVLIPEWQRVNQPHKHRQIKGGHEEWLIVDKHTVDLYDRECNRIGSSYKAFRFQESRCNQFHGACFEITAKKIFDHALSQKKNGIKSRFFPTFYGEMVGPYYQQSNQLPSHIQAKKHDGSPTGALFKNQSAAPVRLVYKSQHVHNSLVVLTFTADSISFVSNRSPGRIVEAFIQDFSALGEAGNLYVIVQNIGAYTADYEVIIEACTDGIIRVSSKQQTVNPREQAEFFFQISASLNIDANHTCYINLIDDDGVSLDRTPIQFSTFRTCYCLGQCECKCDNKELRTTSKICDKKNINPFWNPPIIIKEEEFCYHCWFTDSFKNPVSAIFMTIMILLCIGMGKMFFVHFCCRYKDGRPIDVVGIVLGTTNMQHTKEKSRNATIQFLLGVCFFVYLPFLPLLMLFCHWRRKRMAKKRLKKKVERKKRRILLRKRAALAAMKGIMVEQVGVGRQMSTGGMEETFTKMKGPKGVAPKMPKKLVVSSTSSDTSDYDFDHSESTGEEDADTLLTKDPKSLKLARPRFGKKR